MVEITVREAPGPKGDTVERVSPGEKGKSWAIKQLKRRFGIDIHPDRIHL